MRSDMENKITLFEHPLVQKQVLETMKHTVFFIRFYENIKLYFLHTYLYETLVFAKKRGLTVEFEEFLPLAIFALGEYEDIDKSIFSKYIPKQMELYRLIKAGLTKENYEKYFSSL